MFWQQNYKEKPTKINLHKGDGEFPIEALTRSYKEGPITSTKILQDTSSFFSWYSAIEPPVGGGKTQQMIKQEKIPTFPGLASIPRIQ